MNRPDRTARRTVERFLAAENARDYDQLAELVAETIECVTWPGGDRVTGRDAFVEGMRDMYRGRESRFEVTASGADDAAGAVLVEFLIEGKRSVCVFEVRDGLITAEREYLGDGY